MIIYSTLLAFGDSLTFGSRDEDGQSYPVYLSNMIKKKYGQLLIFENAGVTGETTTEAAKRAYRTIGTSKCDEVIFFEGINDSKDNVRTPLEIYTFNVEYITWIAKALEKRIYLGLTPLLKGFGLSHYSVRSNELIPQYNSIVQQIAKKHNVPLIDFREMPADCYADGVHMNRKGYNLIAKKVLEAIEKERKFGEL